MQETVSIEHYTIMRIHSELLLVESCALQYTHPVDVIS